MAKPINGIKGFVEVTIQGQSTPMLIPLHNIAGVTQRNGVTRLTVMRILIGFDAHSHSAYLEQSYEEVLKRIQEATY
jgi:hypothetical protein